MSDRIELRGLRLAGVVGVTPEERRLPQPLSFDLELVRPFEAAALSDDLAETTNYAAVLDVVARLTGEGEFLLLETLAYRVAQEVLAFDPEITEVTVAVSKLHPPVPEDVATVGVRTTLTR